MIDILGIIEILFPSRCAICDCKIKRLGLCERCKDQIEPIKYHCLGCGLPLNTGFFDFCGNCIDKNFYFDSMWVLYDYKDVSRLILDLKLNRNVKSKKAIETLINKGFSLRKIYKVYNLKEIDTITFVPLHWKKQFQREFNQSEEIAHIIAKMINKPVKALIKKKKATKDQTDLSLTERKINLKGAFTAFGDVKNKTILLVDDVATTLNTLNYCSLTLKQQKAKKVIAFSFSRATNV